MVISIKFILILFKLQGRVLNFTQHLFSFPLVPFTVVSAWLLIPTQQMTTQQFVHPGKQKGTIIPIYSTEYKYIRSTFISSIFHHCHHCHQQNSPLTERFKSPHSFIYFLILPILKCWIQSCLRSKKRGRYCVTLYQIDHQY